ncbi:CDP-alcohol phosphatidyltransferase family protein [Pseudodesulfovibrio tunisiensis]|uniref:CDP-alcohol phosphatidyltransferase family protein n=1 Tax=Pseudodesulfovibrio tunisiensis TaxID=463192 RepID=UPI001FB3EF8C|nr:CDP-alcohol phosphatidyltransferase family protein [Pseudodesulfovibrio tunisiensis]
MSRDSIWTVPNLLTASRILLTPAFVVAYTSERFYLAWALFAIAGLTDALDGFLARLLRQRSQLGAMLDPLADKTLLVTSFICLALQGWIPTWLAVLAVSRDAIIVGGLVFLQIWGVDVKSRIQPIWASKFTTTAQILLVIYVMLEKTFMFSFPVLLQSLIWVTGLLTIVSGILYFRRGFAMMAEPIEDRTC